MNRRSYTNLVVSGATGVVSWFNSLKRYGVIQRDDNGYTIFVHANSVLCVQADGDSSGMLLLEGDQVKFDIIKKQKGLEAVNVRALDGSVLVGRSEVETDRGSTRRVQNNTERNSSPRSKIRVVYNREHSRVVNRRRHVDNFLHEDSFYEDGYPRRFDRTMGNQESMYPSRREQYYDYRGRYQKNSMDFSRYGENRIRRYYQPRYDEFYCSPERYLSSRRPMGFYERERTGNGVVFEPMRMGPMKESRRVRSPRRDQRECEYVENRNGSRDRFNRRRGRNRKDTGTVSVKSSTEGCDKDSISGKKPMSRKDKDVEKERSTSESGKTSKNEALLSTAVQQGETSKARSALDGKSALVVTSVQVTVRPKDANGKPTGSGGTALNDKKEQGHKGDNAVTKNEEITVTLPEADGSEPQHKELETQEFEVAKVDNNESLFRNDVVDLKSNMAGGECTDTGAACELKISKDNAVVGLKYGCCEPLAANACVINNATTELWKADDCCTIASTGTSSDTAPETNA